MRGRIASGEECLQMGHHRRFALCRVGVVVFVVHFLLRRTTTPVWHLRQHAQVLCWGAMRHRLRLRLASLHTIQEYSQSAVGRHSDAIPHKSGSERAELSLIHIYVDALSLSKFLSIVRV